VIYQFENPYRAGKIETVVELAPIIYGVVDTGDSIKIYYNELGKPKARIKFAPHYWLITMIIFALFAFLLFVTILILKNHTSFKKQVRLFLIALLVFFSVPLVISVQNDLRNKSLLAKEKLAESAWPSWPAFEQAVPKPHWWRRVAIKFFDPMNYTSEEIKPYLRKNKGHDRTQRQFKVAYAKILKHKGDPLQIGWDIMNGTTQEFTPLYEFFVSYFMYQEWEGDCTNPCNDATQTVQIAADLISMKLDEDQVDSSLLIIENILKYKYDRARNAEKYAFLYSYRRLLEHTVGVDRAREALQPLVEGNIKEAREQGLSRMTSKWQYFWEREQRRVGMYAYR